MNCPACGRPVAVARASCLYCGAALSAEAVAAAHAASEKTARSQPFAGAAPEAAPQERTLLILDPTGVDARALAGALASSAYEAGQRLKRGGPQLLKVLAREEATREAERLAGLGLEVFEVPERDARLPPLVALGGRLDGPALELRVERGSLRLSRDELCLVVRGPIAREYQTRTQKKGLPLATLEPGYRFHLHRVAEPAPLELDPWAFAFGAGARAGQSSLLTLAAWIEAFARGVPSDDGFRLLPPALAVAEPDEGGLRTTLGKKPEKGASVALDNLRQFRFYSAWRGAVERRRRG